MNVKKGLAATTAIMALVSGVTYTSVVKEDYQIASEKLQAANRNNEVLGGKLGELITTNNENKVDIKLKSEKLKKLEVANKSLKQELDEQKNINNNLSKLRLQELEDSSISDEYQQTDFVEEEQFNNEVEEPLPPKEEVETPKTSLSFEATAYDGFGMGGLTATGYQITGTGDKVVAVDPNVIPLGSTVFIEGYGEARAVDTGGAINGNIIDLNMSESEAEQWGRRMVNVEIY